MFILLNVAIGGTLGGAVDPTLTQATMEVDYVAHCTATTANAATRCNESTARGEDDLTIFEDIERADWAAWDASGGTTPTVFMDADMTYAETMQFSINGSTVVGFTTRPPDAVGGLPFDATGFSPTGTLELDLKMTTSPGVTDWKLKVESVGVATEVEVSLSSSNEGHAAPILDQWQHYSFDLDDLAALGLDIGQIDIVMVFPEFGTGDGAVFQLDNVKILRNTPQATNPPVSGGGSSGGGGSSSSVDFMLLLVLAGLTVVRRFARR